MDKSSWPTFNGLHKLKIKLGVQQNDAGPPVSDEDVEAIAAAMSGEPLKPHRASPLQIQTRNILQPTLLDPNQDVVDKFRNGYKVLVKTEDGYKEVEPNIPKTMAETQHEECR